MAPWFLGHLGLQAGATRADVRRAYARKLKAIDQEREIEAFQQLRRAYEAALGWVETGAGTEAETEAETERFPVPPSPPREAWGRGPGRGGAPDADPPDEPHPPPDLPSVSSLLAEALSRPGALASARAAVEALARCLDDERLVELERREELEWRVAERLAAGWAPGHEHLLPAAVSAFEWHTDRRRLDRLGRPGLVLERVLAERWVIDQLSPADRGLLLDATAWLRRTERPPSPELIQFLPTIEAAEANFPAWLAVTAPAERLGAWRAQEAELSAWRRASLKRQRRRRVLAATAPSPSRREWMGGGWLAAVVVMMLLRGLHACEPAGVQRTTAAQPPVGPSLTTCELGFPRDCLEKARAAERRGDAATAASLFGRACDGRLVEACLHLAAGHEQRKEEHLATPWYERACRLGHWNACNSLGVQVSRGAGAAKDLARAADLYQRACDHAVAIACGNLAISYVRGEGVKRNEKRAVALLETACDGEDGRSCTLLARFVAVGAGVKRDRARARTLFARACALKDEEGCREAR